MLRGEVYCCAKRSKERNLTMQKSDKTYLFEQAPIPKAVMTLAIPGVLSSMVMVLYNLADTWFVGMLGDPVQTAAVKHWSSI